jgi:hypothetical protein
MMKAWGSQTAHPITDNKDSCQAIKAVFLKGLPMLCHFSIPH